MVTGLVALTDPKTVPGNVPEARQPQKPGPAPVIDTK